MKHPISRLFTIGIAVLLFTAQAYAETRFVIDKMQITFRTGPGNDRKIISILNSDQRVEVIQPEGDWAKVRLQNGKEGWVLQRYLSAETPCRIRIKETNQARDQLESALESVRSVNDQLTSEKTKLTADLKKTTQALSKTKAAFEKLKKDAAGFLELKTINERTTKRLSEQTQKAESLDEELDNLLKKQNIRWFLGGSGVLLLGFILGFSSKKQKRQSSLL